MKNYRKVSQLPGQPIQEKALSSWAPPQEALTDTVKAAIAKIHAAGLPTTHGDDKGLYNLFPDGRKEYFKLNWTLANILEKRQEILGVVKKYGVSNVQVSVKEFEIGEECELFFLVQPKLINNDGLIKELEKILRAKVSISESSKLEMYKLVDL